MRISRLETLLALKAILLAPNLVDSDRQIGAALIEHYNRETGRCDPGLDRLSAIFNLSVRTVIRSEKRLVNAGLFKVVRHGGYSNRNSYEPVWTKFWDILKAWDARLKPKRVPDSQVSLMSPSRRQPCHLGGDSAVTQTYRDNLSKQTCSKRTAEQGNGAGPPNPELGRSPASSSSTPSRTAAERRWTSALHDRFAAMPVTYGEIIELIDDDIRHAATDAELRHRGAGLDLILTRFRLHDRKG